MATLIKNGTVVTQNAKREIVKADILLSDEGVVEEIGKDIDEKAELVIDASNHIVMPGLINTHTHIAMTLFRGYGEGLPLHDWLGKKIWPAEAKLTPEVVKAGAVVGIIEALKSGTTAFNEMYIAGMKEIMDAADELNIRAVISRGMFDVGEHTIDEQMDHTYEVIEEAKKHSELVQAAISCHAPYTASSELIAKAKELARKENLLFHIHVAETRHDVVSMIKQRGVGCIEYLYNLGVLDDKTVLAHASWVSTREIRLVGQAHATVSHNPISNLKLATGSIAHIYEYEKAGANVTLGTDGAASNNSLNMFETMKFAALLQKHKYWKADILPDQRILDFATVNGGKVLGVPASIEVGKKADIIVVKKTPNLLPEHNIIANLIYASSPVSVEWSIANGKVSVEERKVPNEEVLLEKALNEINLFFEQLNAEKA